MKDSLVQFNFRTCRLCRLRSFMLLVLCITGGDDKTLKYWEIATERCLKTIQFEDRVQSVAWNPSASLSLVAVVV